jgi:hypothetical protein
LPQACRRSASVWAGRRAEANGMASTHEARVWRVGGKAMLIVSG